MRSSRIDIPAVLDESQVGNLRRIVGTAVGARKHPLAGADHRQSLLLLLRQFLSVGRPQLFDPVIGCPRHGKHAPHRDRQRVPDKEPGQRPDQKRRITKPERFASGACGAKSNGGVAVRIHVAVTTAALGT